MSHYANGFKIGLVKVLLIAIIAPSVFPCVFPSESQEPIKVPDFEKKTLLNGMQFLFLKGTGGRIPFLLMIENGAAFDPADKSGVTNLMARMMLTGLSQEQVRRDVEAAAIEIKTEVDWDAIYFSGISPPEGLPLALSVLADLVVRPQFDEQTFAETRDTILDEVRQRTSQIEVRTQDLFQAMVLSGSPYAHPVQGTVESLTNLDLQDVKIQFRRLLMPNQARLALYYDGDREELFQGLSRRWGSWVQGQAAPFTFRQATDRDQTAVVLLDFPAEDNAILRWGTLSADKASRDYHALKVLEQYLTLSLPDWAEEIAYSNQIRGSARLVAKKMPGYFQVSLRSREEHLLAYCRKLEDTIEMIKAGKIDNGRFEEAKSLVFREFKDSFQEPYEQLYQLLGADLYELGLNYIPTFSLRLKRVSPTVFENVVRSYFKGSGSVVVLAGSVAKLEAAFKEIGPVEVLK